MAIEQRCYRSRWVIPVEGEPIPGGCVSIADGRIVEIQARATQKAVDLGDSVIVAGFVNAHTHLDLPRLHRHLDLPVSFVDWLREVVALKRSSPVEDARGVIASGIGQLIDSGTTLVGEVATTQSSAEQLRDVGMSAVVFREVLGLRPERYEPLWESAVCGMRSAELGMRNVERGMRNVERGTKKIPHSEFRVPRSSDSMVLPGLSPHAPYSTASEIYQRAGRQGPGVRLATHWFESPEELLFLRTGTGPLRSFLEEIGALDEGQRAWQPPGDLWGEFLAGSRDPWILVHGNYLSKDDLGRLSHPSWRDRCRGVVYCPRTHAYFGHAPHPWQALRAAGIAVALGTDSLASNPDLRVFEEARFLAARNPDLHPGALLEMLTIDGARVLGLDQETGSLEIGKRADLVVLKMDTSADRDPIAALFAPETRVDGVMIEGRWMKEQG